MPFPPLAFPHLTFPPRELQEKCPPVPLPEITPSCSLEQQRGSVDYTDYAVFVDYTVIEGDNKMLTNAINVDHCLFSCKASPPQATTGSPVPSPQCGHGTMRGANWHPCFRWLHVTICGGDRNTRRVPSSYALWAFCLPKVPIWIKSKQKVS